MNFADNLYSWSLEPQILVAAALAGTAYGVRLRDLWAHGGATRHAGDYLRAASFGAGLVVLVIALTSPIDRLGEERLFCVHMVQHLLLTDIAPILLLLGLSRAIMRPLVRRGQPIERALGVLAHPLAALIALVVVIWGWHVAAMYELALNHPWAHELEHLTFFTAGIAFWWYVIEPVPPRHRLQGMWMPAYVFAAKLTLGALGVALAFSPNAIYDFYVEAPRTWGLTAVEDLNIGGLVMMVEQSVVLVIFFSIMLARMLDRSEEMQRRRERFGDYVS
jgi:putative membrane protein